MMKNKDWSVMKYKEPYSYLFNTVSLNEVLHSYAFHFSTKTNVKRSRQGRHKAETKTIAFGRQPIAFFVC